MKKCKNCIHGTISSTHQDECWLTEKNIGTSTNTRYSAIRRNHAKVHNREGACKSFERKKIKIFGWYI
jgi:hypothetical protein